MALEGSLRDLSLPTLVQSLIQDGGSGIIQIRHEDHLGVLHIDAGQLLFAAVQTGSDQTGRREGAAAVYELLGWHDGNFAVERKKVATNRNVEQPWSYLLMEGLRLIDEQQVVGMQSDMPDLAEETLADMLAGLSPDDAAAIRSLVDEPEDIDIMAMKSEELNQMLRDFVGSSNEILGAVIVDNDGLLLANALNGRLDGNRVAAISAGLVSLAGRSASQLEQGAVRQTLIQAENGNIIALRAGEKASLVALTAVNTNLGLIFLRTQDLSKEIRDALS